MKAAAGEDRSIPELHVINTGFGRFLKAISACFLTWRSVASFSRDEDFL